MPPAEIEGKTPRWEAYKSIASVGLPLTFGSLIALISGSADLIIMGLFSSSSMAAVASGVTVYELLINAVSALLLGHQILAARASGADDATRLSQLVTTNIRAAAAFGIVFSVILVAAGVPVLQLIAPHEVVGEATQFLMGLIPAPFFYCLYIILLRTLNAEGITGVTLKATALVATVNVSLDFLLIFGLGPIPSLGTLGCGIATSVAMGIGLLFVSRTYRTSPVAKRLAKVEAKASFKLALESLSISWPIALTMAAGYLVNLIFFAMMGRLSPADLAGGRLAFQAMLIVMSILTGFATGSSIVISRSIGKGDQEVRLVSRRTLEVLILGGLALGVLLVVMAGAALAFAGPPPSVTQAAAVGLFVVGVSLVPLAIAVNSSAGLRATKSTRAELIIDLCATWLVQLPVAWVLGFYFHLGVLGLFLALLAYWLVRAMVSFVVFGRILSHVERQMASAGNN